VWDSRQMNEYCCEKVFETLIPYSTNLLCQVMENMLNVVCSYFHINMHGTSYLIMGPMPDNGWWN
jgi:hypothetical protein